MVKPNYSAVGDIVPNPPHVAGYGTGFEGNIVVAVYGDGGKKLAEEGLTQKTGGMGEVGKFYGNVRLEKSPPSKSAWSRPGAAGGARGRSRTWCACRSCSTRTWSEGGVSRPGGPELLGDRGNPAKPTAGISRLGAEALR